MHNNCSDLLELAGGHGKRPVKPEWWDENGTPRFRPFAPDLLPDIYANQAVLLLIECQDCRKRFKVGMSYSSMDEMRYGLMFPDMKPSDLRGAVVSKAIHYGDPPNSGHVKGCAGPTMNCEDLKVLEFWEQSQATGHRWQRVPELEIDVIESPEGETS